VAQVIYGPVVARKKPGEKYPGPTEVGRLITEARARRGFSQDDVARLLNAITGMKAVSRHEVSRWERGSRLPSRYWLGWIAAALNER
jgi:transcriptional regulator with XRE-family HTH domain